MKTIHINENAFRRLFEASNYDEEFETTVDFDYEHGDDVTYIEELPLRISYDYEPGEAPTFDCPGCSSRVDIMDIEVIGDLSEYGLTDDDAREIEKRLWHMPTYIKSFEEEAMENHENMAAFWEEDYDEEP